MNAERNSLNKALLGISSLVASCGLLVGLTACAEESTQSSTPTTSKSASASAHSITSSTPSPTPTKTSEASTQISASCSTLLSDEVLDKTYPGYESKNGYTPAPGSAGEAALKEKGVACQWTNPNTGLTLTISAAHLGPQALSTISASLPGTPTTEYSASSNSKGSFQVVNGAGSAQLVTDKFWITADSGEFYSSADAVSIMSMLLAALEWDANP
ncbi:MAG: hypothetical protein RR853_02130 [Aurantimicrobium sp.]|uniref:hypothetical protein n=1 Tax=Aurantimicrobium sp. TaxID=1930784 RepID=UPI002FCB900A